jgi:protein-S-isoprenylcysteine O-methyltransferase Ste14
MTTIFVFARAITYAVLFVGLVLIYLPARVLSWATIAPPSTMAGPQVAGIVVGTGGGLIALWCVLTFASVGRGTPAPFDPPQRLVSSGPYRVMRNPMYLGAALALIGAAAYYESLPILGYATLFGLLAHVFVVVYEEPTLRRLFGDEYVDYCRRVRRWAPRLKRP